MSFNLKRKLMPLALGFVASVGCYTASPAQAGLVSEKQEIDVGRQSAAQIESKYRVSRNARHNRLVQSIGNRLADVSSRPNLPWTFKVLDDPMLNAVALPGGYIYVFRGLIDRVGSDTDMLAGVLAHEVAHVSAKHHVETMEKQMAGSLIIGLLLKGKSQNYASMFANIYALKWSRNDEYESDKLGVQYATRAGFDPHGLPRFLRVLESQGGGRGPTWLSSHPNTSERVKRATQYANAAGGSRSSSSRRRSSNYDDRYDSYDDSRYERRDRSSRRDGYYLGRPAQRR